MIGQLINRYIFRFDCGDLTETFNLLFMCTLFSYVYLLGLVDPIYPLLSQIRLSMLDRLEGVCDQNSLFRMLLKQRIVNHYHSLVCR